MISIVILGLILLGAVLWWLLDRHEQRRSAAGLARHSALRLVFAAAALLTMLFTGGCGLLFWVNRDGQYVTAELIAVLAGVPFLIALVVWWAVMRRGRQPPP